MTERFILVDGGRNLRDLGGYRTADGRSVGWNRVYRSGSLGQISPTGFAALSDLGIRTVVDLRANRERVNDTSAAFHGSVEEYWVRDYDYSQGDLHARFSQPEHLTPEGARALMTEVYAALPFEQAPAYAALFERLLAADLPLLFKCSAGKDRTGLGAALLLTALGVEWQVVMEDFLLSIGAPGMETLTVALAGVMTEEQLRPLAGVEASYLESAFSAIQAQHGSVLGYLASLGFGPAEIEALRNRLLTDAQATH